jgi:hypothetical protein
VESQEVPMPGKKPSMLLPPAVQTELFRPTSRCSTSWPRIPDAVKPRVVEVLAQLLLHASGAAPENEETVDD